MDIQTDLKIFRTHVKQYLLKKRLSFVLDHVMYKSDDD